MWKAPPGGFPNFGPLTGVPLELGPYPNFRGPWEKFFGKPGVWAPGLAPNLYPLFGPLKIGLESL